MVGGCCFAFRSAFRPPALQQFFCGICLLLCGPPFPLIVTIPIMPLSDGLHPCTPAPRLQAWEGKAYAYGRQSLREMGCPVEGLRFDRSLVIRGLIMDTGGQWRAGSRHAVCALHALCALHA